MASTAALSGLQGKFPLDPPDTSDRDHNKLSQTVPGAGGGKQSALVLIIDDVEDLETVDPQVAIVSTRTNMVMKLIWVDIYTILKFSTCQLTLCVVIINATFLLPRTILRRLVMQP